jgi:hypothetical protein
MYSMRLEARRRAPQPLFLELHHLVGEAHALLADAVALGHAHIGEMDLRGVGTAHADLVDACARSTPLAFIGTQISDLLRCAGPSPVLASRQTQSACVVGDPHLAAVDDVVVAVGRAVVLIEATSEPAPGSDTPMQATYRP